MRFELKTNARLRQLFVILSVFGLLGLSACDGISTKPLSTACTTAKSASINVYEGVMSRACGCVEGGGTFSQSNSLICTVPIGTAIYFNFINIINAHQITVSTIGTTQQIDPSSTVKTAALVMSLSGTFPFSDTSSFGGSIVVTP